MSRWPPPRQSQTFFFNSKSSLLCNDIFNQSEALNLFWIIDLNSFIDFSENYWQNIDQEIIPYWLIFFICGLRKRGLDSISLKARMACFFLLGLSYAGSGQKQNMTCFGKNTMVFSRTKMPEICLRPTDAKRTLRRTNI